MPDDPNPYAAPLAPLREPYVWQGFRPRHVPTVACYALGIISTFTFVVMGGDMLLTIYRYRGRDPGPDVPTPYGPSREHLTFLVSHLLVGVNGILGGRAWIAGRWRMAIISSVIMTASILAFVVIKPFL